MNHFLHIFWRPKYSTEPQNFTQGWQSLFDKRTAVGNAYNTHDWWIAWFHKLGCTLSEVQFFGNGASIVEIVSWVDDVPTPCLQEKWCPWFDHLFCWGYQVNLGRGGSIGGREGRSGIVFWLFQCWQRLWQARNEILKWECCILSSMACWGRRQWWVAMLNAQ